MTETRERGPAGEGVHIDHEFKSHPSVFWPAARGEKTFEYRRDDRGGYAVGQTVRLRCYTPGVGYTPVDPLDRCITNILRGGEFELPEGFCILNLAPLPASQAAPVAGVEGEIDRLRVALSSYETSGNSANSAASRLVHSKSLAQPDRLHETATGGEE